MAVMEAKTSFRILDSGEQPVFRSDRVAAFYRYWLDIARDGLPTREAIDPAAMLPLLPYIMLIDLEDVADRKPGGDDPDANGVFRVRYRLVGTAVAKFSGLDFTNAYLDELDFDVCTTDDLLRAYLAIRRARRPGLGMALAELEDDQIMDVEYLICPLAPPPHPSAGASPIRQCVAIEDYMPSANYDQRTKLGRKTT